MLTSVFLSAQSSDEKFSTELSIALEHIESLTDDEAKRIAWIVGSTKCEPLTAFLALHVTLAYILAAPHSREFRAALRAWGANHTLDVMMWGKFVKGAYRPRYQVGRGLTAADVDLILEQVSWLDFIGARVTELGRHRARDAAANVRAKLAIGDVFRRRYTHWPAGEWGTDLELVAISSRGSLLCRKLGKKTKITFSEEILSDPRLEIEVIRRANRETATPPQPDSQEPDAATK